MSPFMRPKRLRRYVNGKRQGYCKRTVGPKKVHRENSRVKYSAGLKVVGVGFITADMWSRSSAITCIWNGRYKRDWRCGDGGRRNELDRPDPKTSINRFAGADTVSGRNR